MKNKTMRVAALLLALTLMTSCFVGGTFAKYTTAGHAEDSARVAKWGVEIVGKVNSENNLFKTTYDTDVAWAGDDGVSVKAGVAVVAPGTDGQLTGFAVTGTPEVDVEVTYVADLQLAGWEVDVTDDSIDNPVYYCPLIIWVDKNGNGAKDAGEEFNGVDYANATAFEEAVEGAIVAATMKYNAGTNLNTIDNDVTVTWEWPFEVGTGEDLKANDKKDTALGDAAAADNAATIKLIIDVTVTQID